MEVSSEIDSTWLPNVPATPWFLPWMSLAIAPPTVTCCVPGTTGTVHPAGTSTSSRSPIVAPACCGDDPMFGVELEPPQPCGIEHEPARQLSGVAVTASFTAGDRTADAPPASSTAVRNAATPSGRTSDTFAPGPPPQPRTTA